MLMTEAWRDDLLTLEQRANIVPSADIPKPTKEFAASLPDFS